MCLFRGSHLSVLYKRLDPVTKSTMLYTLVTDRVFLREPSIVWESLVDVDGQSSSFYDSYMSSSTPAGGDFAGQTAEQIARAHDRREEDVSMSLECVQYFSSPERISDALSISSFKLARQLQLEEDHDAYEQQRRQQAAAQVGGPQNGTNPPAPKRPSNNQRLSAKKEKKKDKDKGECIIM